MDKEINRLKKMILSLGAEVEERLTIAVRAAVNRDGVSAQSVVNGDSEIDIAEVEVEEECLKILALHQPVAADLRFIVSVFKIDSDLERIADLAVNIASRAKSLASGPIVNPPMDLVRMGEKVREMVHQALQSFVSMDAAIARGVLSADRDVDSIHKEAFTGVGARIKANPDEADALLQYISISRNLERVGDHAKNIAEDVLYMIDGEIVRHRPI